MSNLPRRLPLVTHALTLAGLVLPWLVLSARHALAQPDRAQPDLTQPVRIQPDIARFDRARPGEPRPQAPAFAEPAFRIERLLQASRPVVQRRTAARLVDPDPLRTAGPTQILALDLSLWTGGGLPLPDATPTPPQAQDRLIIADVPLPAGRRVALELTRFRVTAPGFRAVIGRPGLPDEPVAFNPDGIAFYRGHVQGVPRSSVFLALTPTMSTGTIDLGPGRARLHLSNRGPGGEILPVGRLALFPATLPTSLPPGVRLCGLAGKNAGPSRPGDADPPQPRKGLRQVELAVETDYEMFEMFHSVDDTLEYVLAVYAAVSDIFQRELNLRVDLTFVRLWVTPDDLFNQPDPLGPFAAYWNNFMKHVPRDAAQFFSGRRNLPAGGVAYLAQICTDAAYSWAGYASGLFPEPDQANWTNGDVMVTAHELGHNVGTLHTHDYGLDSCQDPSTAPRRGGIMSYCGQTFSGGDANHDLRFEIFTRRRIATYLATRPCVMPDCNQNFVGDAADIAAGTSTDANRNGIPDECEDCNRNGTLDDQDILSGASKDLNTNTIPDECEPDCNRNGVPDDKDIADRTSRDLYDDGVPDECERDCNGNTISDYTEIQRNMSLDVDRNTVLDNCQDCDSDGLPDVVELEAAHDLWAGSHDADHVLRRFFASTGVLVKISAAHRAHEANDVLITPDRRVLVTSVREPGMAGPAVVEFDRDGAFVRELVPGGVGGVAEPGGMLLSPRGTLLVASGGTDEVLEYDLTTGASLGALVSAGAGGLDGPFGLALGPGAGGRRNLFVTSAAGQVMEFDARTGAFIRVFVTLADNGGLKDPRGMVFKPDGALLVASQGSNAILAYAAGTGRFLGKWNRNGTETRLTLEEPWGLRVGPNGNIFASVHHQDLGIIPAPLHLTQARIYEFDVRNGNYIRAFVQGDDTGLFATTGFDFVPGGAIDCNQNQIPDSCDIDRGTSKDVNGNGRPDECDCFVDLNGDGRLSAEDFVMFQNLFALRDLRADFTGDEKLDVADFAAYQTAFSLGCR